MFYACIGGVKTPTLHVLKSWGIVGCAPRKGGAVHGDSLIQRQVREIKPYKIDNNCIIPQVIEAIPAYDYRLVRALSIKGRSQYPIRRPWTDPFHARQLRLITATLGNRMNELITFLGEGHEKDGWC